MVCSACGYENQVGNRFCGMCGTPLPHRPLTTPSAQSTASLTRPLAENGTPPESRASAAPPARTGLEVETGPQRSKAEPSQFNLVPEIPLHEYVQNFRYVPPSDPQEITMRCETPVLGPEPPASPNATSVVPVETATATAEAAPPPSADDVRERLGLEVDGTAEERSDRPRFLDFNQPPASRRPAVAATSISGPSFLGLSDAPQVEAATGDDLGVEEPARGNWRIWLVATVVLMFGFLGALEWRAQVRQTNNGLVEVIRTKMRSLTHGKPAEIASTESASPATSPDSASKPEMQVESPANPQNQNPPASTATSTQAKDAVTVPHTNAATTPPAGSAAAKPAPVAGNQPATGQSTAKPPQNAALNAAQTPAGQNAAAAKTTTTTTTVDKSKLIGSQQPGSTAAPTADKPKPSPRTADEGEEVAAKKVFSGADEMAKANNASDSAAEAAWLWKATAKGNPAAPVRLADMYVKGDGVPRSCEQAMVLLKTAATKENALARNRLASMYSSGICVQRNRVEAYRWLSSALAANPNSEWAQQHRDQLWQQMTPEERALAEKYR